MFDTVWAAALALNNTAAKLPSGQSLLDFNYSNSYLSAMIYREALDVSFFGLTVSVYLINLMLWRHNMMYVAHRDKFTLRIMETDQGKLD